VSGELSNIYTGLTPGATLFTGFGARLVETVERPFLGTRVVQPIAYALSTDTLIINIQRPFRIGIA
jgi:hypothetical protein